ncbi:protein of unknown function [Pararobbsia alpina]
MLLRQHRTGFVWVLVLLRTQHMKHMTTFFGPAPAFDSPFMWIPRGFRVHVIAFRALHDLAQSMHQSGALSLVISPLVIGVRTCHRIFPPLSRCCRRARCGSRNPSPTGWPKPPLNATRPVKHRKPNVTCCAKASSSR